MTHTISAGTILRMVSVMDDAITKMRAVPPEISMDLGISITMGQLGAYRDILLKHAVTDVEVEKAL